MNRERVKVYTYKRVSTTMQIDGYSLDAQKSRIKAFADYNDYEIVREYEDAGKSGKSIEGRMLIQTSAPMALQNIWRIMEYEKSNGRMARTLCSMLI